MNDELLPTFELLASALSGKVVRVVRGVSGESAWTDGNTIFIDVTCSEHEQLAALVVQACLLSAGSLAADILRKLKRHPQLAKRYLAIEVHRALNNNVALLPASMHRYVDKNIAACTDSPKASLEFALGRETIAEPPLIFGIIHASRVLATNAIAEKNSNVNATARFHSPRQQREMLAELTADDDDDNQSSLAVDKFSVGGAAGAIGRWLQKWLSASRRGEASGTPGTDTGTHRSRHVTQRGIASVMSTATLDAVENLEKNIGHAKYPEWDMYRKRYRTDWCSVQELEPLQKQCPQLSLPDTGALRKPLARIGLGLDHCHRQAQGDDIDIDAAIAARIEVIAGSIPDENIYVDNLRRRRDLSVLILLDISGSAGEPGALGKTVHEQQRAAAAALASALHDLGDRVALYAYNSRGRSFVQLIAVKRFNEHFNVLTLQRISNLSPGAYSRLGAAIRHGAAVLEAQGGTSRKLLLVLSDGLAYDHGYEKDYGAADARRALAEARRRGTGSLCLTFSAHADTESLRRVFGSAAHATISNSAQLSQMIGPLFQSALRAAEVRRRIS